MKALAQSVVQARWFQRTLVAVILLAGVLAGLETDARLVTRWGATLRLLDACVLGVFVGEIVLKLVAHGRRPWEYFRDGWNVFDFGIVAICLLPLDSQFVAVLRVARALRLLRLVTALPKLQLLVGALLKSLSAMGYVSLLLGMLFYIYAVAGVQLFGAGSPEYFRSLPSALLTLFRVVTLDNWGDMFLAQLDHAPAWKVAGYFVTFIVLGTMIILNLFIGIIMNSMAEMHAEIAAQTPPPSSATGADDLAELQRLADELQHRVGRLRRRGEAA